MRKALWAVLIIGVIIALDVGLANIPGPVPTSQSVSTVEGSLSFQIIVGNGTYHYAGYSDDPSTSLQCVGGPSLEYIDPFHEDTTTTLIFGVTPNLVHRTLGDGTNAGLPFLLLTQINPTSGAIQSFQIVIPC
jgi:hypothetical protein